MDRYLVFFPEIIDPVDWVEFLTTWPEAHCISVCDSGQGYIEVPEKVFSKIVLAHPNLSFEKIFTRNSS